MRGNTIKFEIDGVKFRRGTKHIKAGGRCYSVERLLEIACDPKKSKGGLRHG